MTALDYHIDRCGAPVEKHPRFLKLHQVINALEKIKPKRVLYMGGEPTIDPDFANLARLIHRKLESYNVLLTNGSNLPQLDDIDEACVSLKAIDNILHVEYTGKSNYEVLKNFATFYRSNVRLRSESVLIPGYIDSDEIRRVAKFIATVSPDIPYRIDGYIPVPGAPWRQPSPAEVEKAARVAGEYLNRVSYLAGNEKLQHKVVRVM